MKIIGILSSILISLVGAGEWHDCAELPCEGDLYLYEVCQYDPSSYFSSQLLCIEKYTKGNFHYQCAEKGWYDITEEEALELLEDDSPVVYLSRGSSPNFYSCGMHTDLYEKFRCNQEEEQSSEEEGEKGYPYYSPQD